ncbi:MAG: hypothetical protein J5674_01490 [Candidatus Methanomethylophilaceae archaeon]|nr:hypothetical protein [Candidatus Methanomethylophilaceae archaeon]
MTECLTFVERIIPAILPPLVRRCSAPAFRELLQVAEENSDEMFFDFEGLGLTLNAVDVQIKRLDSTRFSVYFS